MSVNKVILLGHTGQEPKLHRGENNGKAYTIATLTLATNVKWKTESGEVKEHTEWHNLTIKNKLAEVVEKYVKKGDKIYVEGSLKTKKIEKDGNVSYYTSVSVHTLEMLGKKPAGPATPEGAAIDDDLPF